MIVATPISEIESNIASTLITLAAFLGVDFSSFIVLEDFLTFTTVTEPGSFPPFGLLSLVEFASISLSYVPAIVVIFTLFIILYS